MATIFKKLNKSSDEVHTRTMLHEAIPITGAICSGTFATDGNIKNYSHGMFQTVFDYPYLSSSANNIFDITVGYANDSSLSSSVNAQNTKKINIYNQMAQVLVGYDVSGNVRNFDKDGNLAAGTKLKECIFLNFARLLSKDEIKKQSFTLTAFTGGTPSARTDLITISDYKATGTYFVNSPAGEYGILYSGSEATEGTGVGLIYYQAGVCVLTGGIFDGHFGAKGATYGTGTFNMVLTGSDISASSDGFRNRLDNISFNNTTELNSTIYFCRANHNDFNYSSNPTYTSSGKINVKNTAKDSPVTYITTVGLYSAANELLAVAKLSEPIKKSPENETIFRVRLDY